MFSTKAPISIPSAPRPDPLQTTLASAFLNAKIELVAVTGLSRDALHIFVAMALFLVVRLLIRGTRGSLVALVVVLMAALAGEWLDHQAEIMLQRECDRVEHWRDIATTLFWPAVLTITLPWLRPRHPVAGTGDPAAVAPSGEDAERGLEQA